MVQVNYYNLYITTGVNYFFGKSKQMFDPPTSLAFRTCLIPKSYIANTVKSRFTSNILRSIETGAELILFQRPHFLGGGGIISGMKILYSDFDVLITGEGGGGGYNRDF